MFTLTRPDGTRPEDLNLSRRALAGAVFGGYAVYALAADAAPITTDPAGLVTGTVSLAAADRAIPAFVARPDAKGKFPTIIVVSEVFGVHEYIRDVCRRLARLGYVAIAPDFFVRAGDPAVINDFNEIRKIVATASDQQVMGDLAAALTFLRAQPYVDRKKLAITGFCWGGAVVWLACERFSDFRAGAAWYGRLTPPRPGDFLGEPDRRWPLQLVTQLKAPVLGLYAGKDQGIPVTDVEAMRTALMLARKKGSDLIVYPEAQHGFHADYRASYDPAAAADGWARMLDHLRKNGVGPKPYGSARAGG
jgi:carboxymethylenebutenolidase